MQRDRPLLTLCAVTLDCADPMALASFYERATGLTSANGSGDDFAGLPGPAGFFPGSQRVKDYRAPNWPGQKEPQQSPSTLRSMTSTLRRLLCSAREQASRRSSRAKVGGSSPTPQVVLPHDFQDRAEVTGSKQR